MSQPQPPQPVDELAPPAQPTGGAQLRAAREAHGLSIDTVAQHLKLAPRQVLAIEDGDFARLPGRTFIRGFARNYARLMHLDPEAIVAALPDADASALHKAAIGPTGRPMGELPDSQQAQRSRWSRWAIPVALLAVIGVAALYEVTREDAEPVARRAPVDPIGPGVALVANAPPSGGETALPNPLPTGETGAVAAPAPVIAETAAPVLPEPASTTLVISYRAPAWTEVRDASGQRLLLSNGAAGAIETVAATPPLDVTIGNATQVTLTWRGAPLDVTPFVKANILRVRLQ